MIRPDGFGPPDFAALAYDTIIPTGHTNQYPDAASSLFVIPFEVKAYQTPQMKLAVDVTGSAPFVGYALGTKTASAGVKELPKITIEGELDTPCTTVGTFNIPSLKLSDPGPNLVYGQIIQMLTDGELSVEGVYHVRKDPAWFRDPLGRIYNNPRVLSFEASYVEQVPGRNTFTMTMKV